MIDTEASGRLLSEVQRLYLERTGRSTFSVLALSTWSEIGREPLRSYLQHGKFPDPDVLARLAGKLGVEPVYLWLKWFGVGQPNDALVRIAEALERAYPPADEVAEGMAAADAAGRELEALGSRSKPRAPRATKGSAG